MCPVTTQDKRKASEGRVARRTVDILSPDSDQLVPRESKDDRVPLGDLNFR